jgi:GABA(A) receptor-associated protein
MSDDLLHKSSFDEPTQPKHKSVSNKIQSKFQKDHTFEIRAQESAKIIAKYPERIPLIVEKLPNNNLLPQISKTKFLVPSDITITQFLFIVRKYLKLDPSVSIYLFCDGVIPNASESISTTYINHKDADGFLYLFYAGENTFG